MTDNCCGCFGAANGDCDECITKGKEKNTSDKKRRMKRIAFSDAAGVRFMEIENFTEEKKDMNENICCCVDGCTWNDKNGHCTHYGIVISDAETGEPICESAEFDEE